MDTHDNYLTLQLRTRAGSKAEAEAEALMFVPQVGGTDLKIRWTSMDNA